MSGSSAPAREAQRLGRLLPPQEPGPTGRTAHFYTIVSRDTVDADFARTGSGSSPSRNYAYRIVDAGPGARWADRGAARVDVMGRAVGRRQNRLPRRPPV